MKKSLKIGWIGVGLAGLTAASLTGTAIALKKADRKAFNDSIEKLNVEVKSYKRAIKEFEDKQSEINSIFNNLINSATGEDKEILKDFKNLLKKGFKESVAKDINLDEYKFEDIDNKMSIVSKYNLGANIGNPNFKNELKYYFENIKNVTNAINEKLKLPYKKLLDDEVKKIVSKSKFINEIDSNVKSSNSLSLNKFSKSNFGENKINNEFIKKYENLKKYEEHILGEDKDINDSLEDFKNLAISVVQINNSFKNVFSKLNSDSQLIKLYFDNSEVINNLVEMGIERAEIANLKSVITKTSDQFARINTGLDSKNKKLTWDQIADEKEDFFKNNVFIFSKFNDLSQKSKDIQNNLANKGKEIINIFEKAKMNFGFSESGFSNDDLKQALESMRQFFNQSDLAPSSTFIESETDLSKIFDFIIAKNKEAKDKTDLVFDIFKATMNASSTKVVDAINNKEFYEDNNGINKSKRSAKHFNEFKDVKKIIEDIENAKNLFETKTNKITTVDVLQITQNEKDDLVSSINDWNVVINSINLTYDKNQKYNDFIDNFKKMYESIVSLNEFKLDLSEISQNINPLEYDIAKEFTNYIDTILNNVTIQALNKFNDYENIEESMDRIDKIPERQVFVKSYTGAISRWYQMFSSFIYQSNEFRNEAKIDSNLQSFSNKFYNRSTEYFKLLKDDKIKKLIENKSISDLYTSDYELDLSVINDDIDYVSKNLNALNNLLYKYNKVNSINNVQTYGLKYYLTKKNEYDYKTLVKGKRFEWNKNRFETINGLQNREEFLKFDVNNFSKQDALKKYQELNWNTFPFYDKFEASLSSSSGYKHFTDVKPSHYSSYDRLYKTKKLNFNGNPLYKWKSDLQELQELIRLQDKVIDFAFDKIMSEKEISTNNIVVDYVANEFHKSMDAIRSNVRFILYSKLPTYGYKQSDGKKTTEISNYTDFSPYVALYGAIDNNEKVHYPKFDSGGYKLRKTFLTSNPLFNTVFEDQGHFHNDEFTYSNGHVVPTSGVIMRQMAAQNFVYFSSDVYKFVKPEFERIAFSSFATSDSDGPSKMALQSSIYKFKREFNLFNKNIEHSWYYSFLSDSRFLSNMQVLFSLHAYDYWRYHSGPGIGFTFNWDVYPNYYMAFKYEAADKGDYYLMNFKEQAKYKQGYLGFINHNPNSKPEKFLRESKYYFINNSKHTTLSDLAETNYTEVGNVVCNYWYDQHEFDLNYKYKPIYTFKENDKQAAINRATPLSQMLKSHSYNYMIADETNTRWDLNSVS
ncbi:hypothetical protein [Mycoplasma sp. Mirounga ES2805-ORL]|uniref:hypothetical protein n=1 Tax=Mycoplasma sp. Mirounga ES2805-ORL TaxID=754514 RepID=UPI00197C59EA|nr:hypothetical protein [Mycoplasma sp. Mirounga ES2805-ORL]QSF13762.1 hypothetical protein JXZ90_00465 [Mycoplasma sp. Mirounga ES2805-ORL]